MSPCRARCCTFLQLKDGRFIDDRWTGGRWDLSKFSNAAGETDWDAVSPHAALLDVLAAAPVASAEALQRVVASGA